MQASNKRKLERLVAAIEDLQRCGPAIPPEVAEWFVKRAKAYLDDPDPKATLDRELNRAEAKRGRPKNSRGNTVKDYTKGSPYQKARKAWKLKAEGKQPREIEKQLDSDWKTLQDNIDKYGHEFEIEADAERVRAKIKEAD